MQFISTFLLLMSGIIVGTSQLSYADQLVRKRVYCHVDSFKASVYVEAKDELSARRVGDIRCRGRLAFMSSGVVTESGRETPSTQLVGSTIDASVSCRSRSDCDQSPASNVASEDIVSLDEFSEVSNFRDARCLYVKDGMVKSDQPVKLPNRRLPNGTYVDACTSKAGCLITVGSGSTERKVKVDTVLACRALPNGECPNATECAKDVTFNADSPAAPVWRTSGDQPSAEKAK